MNIKEHTWDEKKPSVSKDADGNKYNWYEYTPEILFCESVIDGKVYGLDRSTGELIHRKDISIDPSWYHTHREEIMQLMEMSQAKTAKAS